MEEILGLRFLVSLVWSIYFLIRLVIRAIFGGETAGYKTKLVISLGVMIISTAIFFLLGMFGEADEADLKADAERRLEELLEENFPSK